MSDGYDPCDPYRRDLRPLNALPYFADHYGERAPGRFVGLHAFVATTPALWFGLDPADLAFARREQLSALAERHLAPGERVALGDGLEVWTWRARLNGGLLPLDDAGVTRVASLQRRLARALRVGTPEALCSPFTPIPRPGTRLPGPAYDPRRAVILDDPEDRSRFAAARFDDLGEAAEIVARIEAAFARKEVPFFGGPILDKLADHPTITPAALDVLALCDRLDTVARDALRCDNLPRHPSAV